MRTVSSMYRHSSHSMTKEEKKQLYSDINLYYRERAEELGDLLLDSSLINGTTSKKYTHKIIKCGDYYQVYYYHDLHSKKDTSLEPLDQDFIFKKENLYRQRDQQFIEYKNIQRSKFQMQRLVKANENVFKTFMTLTFAENITDLKKAHHDFLIFRKQVKRALQKQKKEFFYIAVPEFQSRGAVHYHILSNIDIKNSTIIIPQNNKKNCYDVKYWNKGFSSVFEVKDINVVGYMTKYMTKDIDNRLFGHRRYYYSRNLLQPDVMYVDQDDIRENSNILFAELMCDLNYVHIYFDKFGNEIEYKEYKLRK